MRGKHQVALDVILSRVGGVEERLDFAMQVLLFIANHSGEFYSLATFAQGQLSGYEGSLRTVKNQAKRLADLADPNVPDDLLF